jgi:hypothetical protein
MILIPGNAEFSPWSSDPEAKLAETRSCLAVLQIAGGIIAG